MTHFAEFAEVPLERTVASCVTDIRGSLLKSFQGVNVQQFGIYNLENKETYLIDKFVKLVIIKVVQ